MVIIGLGLQFEVRRRSGSARGAEAGRGCAGATSVDRRGTVVVSVGLPAIVAGIVSRSAAEEVAIFRGGADQWMILGELRGRLWSFFNLFQRLLKQPLDSRAYVPVAVDAVADGMSTGLLDQPCRIFPAQPDNAPHCALSGASLGIEHVLAERPGLGTDATGVRQQHGGLPRRIERPFVGRQDDRTGVRHPGMNAQQRMGMAITDLDRGSVDAHVDLTAR